MPFSQLQGVEWGWPRSFASSRSESREHSQPVIILYSFRMLSSVAPVASSSVSLATSATSFPSPSCVPAWLGATFGFSSMHSRLIPNAFESVVYPRLRVVASSALFIGSHICASNLPAGKLFCYSRLKIFLPCAWIFCSLRPSSFVSLATFSCTLSSSHLEMPLANVLPPGMCFAMWYHPLVISMRPKSLISSPARLYFAPPYLFTQDTALTSSPRRSTALPAV